MQEWRARQRSWPDSLDGPWILTGGSYSSSYSPSHSSPTFPSPPPPPFSSPSPVLPLSNPYSAATIQPFRFREGPLNLSTGPESRFVWWVGRGDSSSPGPPFWKGSFESTRIRIFSSIARWIPMRTSFYCWMMRRESPPWRYSSPIPYRKPSQRSEFSRPATRPTVYRYTRFLAWISCSTQTFNIIWIARHTWMII